MANFIQPPHLSGNLWQDACYQCIFEHITLSANLRLVTTDETVITTLYLLTAKTIGLEA